MSKNVFQKSIAATLGIAIASAGLFFGVSSQAQNSMPGTMTSPTPATNTAPGTKPTMSAPAKKKPSIVEIALKGKQFSTLVTALKAADLVDTLSGNGPFTVFAPTNAAFAKIPKKTLANLLKPENKEQLKKVLSYHVVSGAVTSNQLKNGQKVPTVEGSPISVHIKNGRVSINNASVITPDVKASNGVIHVIDTVIMPATPKPTKPAK